ncbi:potassium channel family protein [Actinoplanes auranticolor]|uniref:potassium channel family protein n=1 Tax=Actinoplanes auranticolor TaxID=47988 RepID=UPI001FE6976B|nr:potassium channel family protein [Actinoplanes auranticolor]
MGVPDEERLNGWEHRTALPLTILSVLFLVVYAAPILEPGLDADWRRVCATANIVIWALLGVEYVVRLALARDRRRFARTHWFDLAVLLLPILRPLRALRLVVAIKILNRRTEMLTRGRLAVYVAATTVLLVVVAALAVLDAERGVPDGTIATYPEALWWAVVTVTTVGYGDYSPVTVEGRLVALAMMIGGIGLIGFVTGSLASWIVDRISVEDRQRDEAGTADTAALLGEIRALRAEVAGLRSEVSTMTPGGLKITESNDTRPPHGA